MVCWWDYQKRGVPLIGDHKRYRGDDGKWIFGHETLDDVRPLCWTHHHKGVHGDGFIFYLRCRFFACRLLLAVPHGLHYLFFS